VSVMPAPITAMDARTTFEARIARLAGEIARTEPAWLRARRSVARARFAELGLPSQRNEDWRFTSVSEIARLALVPASRGPGGEAEAARVKDAFAPADLGGDELVFVDGLFAPALSRRRETQGVAARSFAHAILHDPERIEPRLGQVSGSAKNGFAALNDALFEDGALVEIAPGTIVRHPIHLVFVSTASAEPTVSSPRVLLALGAGSEATLVETYVGSPDGVYLTCPVTEALLDENASLVRYKLQQDADTAYHVSHFAARLGPHARFRDFSVSMGAALSRHDLDVLFAGEGGEAVLDGVFFADGARHTDTHTRIDHARAHCSSREVYKGIVDGHGRGVFNGRVIVRPGAQKTDASQTNKNLLLSRQALVHSTPQLEILADDVKCKHGATIGQIDEAALFYLRSRGISELAARSLLTFAFVADLIQRIALPSLRERVESRFAGRLSRVAEIKEAAL
jgi:Fe-S cluster assembly protein SufD